MRSKTTPKKRLPKSQLWAYALRLSPELEAPLRQRAADRGGTLQDEIELAVRAWLKVPLPVNYIPEGMEMTLLDEIMCKMKHSNGQSMKSLAEEFHVPYWKMRRICK